MKNMEWLSLPQVIDFETQIKPQTLTQIYGWFDNKEQFYNDLANAYDVLVISVADRKDKNRKYETFSDFIEKNYGEKTLYKAWKESTTVYELIEYYYLNLFDKNDIEKTVWGNYDIIVFDSIHSLYEQSPFSGGPFYANGIIHFIVEYHKRKVCRCKNIILITESPYIFKDYYVDCCKGKCKQKTYNYIGKLPWKNTKRDSTKTLGDV